MTRTQYMYYWEDPGFHGYDYVCLASSVKRARDKAKAAFDGPPEWKDDVFFGLDDPPTGIFHYEAAIQIFTEHDPKTMVTRLTRSD